MSPQSLLRRCPTRSVRFEQLESRQLLSVQPCLLDVPDQGAATRAVEAVNCFGLDLYSQLQQQEGNLFFSPLSVSTAMAMAYAGAAGQTAEEMEDVLHLGSEPGIHESFAALIGALADRTALGDGFTLELANAMWPDVNLPVRQEFIDTIESNYDGTAQNLDYFTDPEAARQIINAWVEEKTRDRVMDLIPPGSLTPATVMVLVNSIYFQANWTDPFDRNMTRNSPFTLETGETVVVPLMYSQFVLPVPTTLDGFRVVELPLEWGRTSMVLAMPVNSSETPNQLTPQLMAKINDWLDSPRETELSEVYLPKFTTTVATPLTDLLPEMGMPIAFTPGAADLSHMTAMNPWIDEVQHKAFFEVNEKGTEAAAATEVEFVICFAAGTPVLTAEGEKPIEQIKAGDYVIAKSEHDAAGKMERKQVEAVFHGHAELFHLHVGGQIIEATEHHRFFVQGIGWTALGALNVGDRLASDERIWLPVDKVVRPGKLGDVYNIRVADHHTYFVGGKAWRFALWTHNDYLPCFRADRPFHFFIRDNVSTTTLFMGRVDDPTQVENDLQADYVSDLTPSVSGTAYLDANQDGNRDPSEQRLADWTVFIDSNRNGLLDHTEPQTSTGSDGSYTLTPSLFSGEVVVALAQEDPDAPVLSHVVTLTAGQDATGFDIGSPTDAMPMALLDVQLDATSEDDQISIKRSGDHLEVFLDGSRDVTPAFSHPVESVRTLNLRLSAGNDHVTIDYTGGNPIPAGGLHLEPGSGRNTLHTQGVAQGDIHIADGNVDIEADPGEISLVVERDAVVRLNSNARPAAIHVLEDATLLAARPGRVLRAFPLTIGPRASLILSGGPLIVDNWRSNWGEAQLGRYVHNGRMRDDSGSPLGVLDNDRGDGTKHFEMIAGESVSFSSLIVAPAQLHPAGDYNGNGIVNQGDLSRVLAYWGTDATEPLLGWFSDPPRGRVDQEELDAVLLNWGKRSEFLPLGEVQLQAEEAKARVADRILLKHRQSPEDATSPVAASRLTARARMLAFALRT